jgi:hypothetical protein
MLDDDINGVGKEVADFLCEAGDRAVGFDETAGRRRRRLTSA